MTGVSDERALWLGRQVLPHEPALRVWLRRKSLGGREVDDIIQETYTRLVAADSVAHVLDARSYAFQVAGSVVIDHLRRMKVVSISQAPNFDYLEVVSDEPSPERQVIDRDELQHLARMIARLPGRARAPRAPGRRGRRGPRGGAAPGRPAGPPGASAGRGRRRETRRGRPGGT